MTALERSNHRYASNLRQGPLRKALAEQIRAEGSRHGLDPVLSAKHSEALEALIWQARDHAR
jgi:hypothetical protein